MCSGAVEQEGSSQSKSGPASIPKSLLWRIHGQYYDLSGFMDAHPGGRGVLEMARGLEDVTALFESYHALSNLTAIRHGLKAHLYTGKVTDDLQAEEAAMMRGVDRNPLAYTYEPGGFYDVLKARVKAHFLGCHTRTPPASPLPWEEAPKAAAPPLTPGESVTVTRYVKATPAWYAKMAALLAVYIPLYLAMLGVDVLGGWGWGRPGVGVRLAAAFAAGALLQCISFCALHDASHYALWRRAGAAHEALSRCCNAWTLWNHAMWMLHHVYGHHSFTGDPTRDPDLIHARPFIRKSLLSPLHEYFRWFVDWQHVVAPGFMCVIPGQSLGQTISYARGAAQGHVWRVPARDVRGGIRWYEWCVYALSVGSHLWGMNIFVSYAYLMGINTLYHLTIAPDHDTYESAVLNARHPKPSSPQDWGEAQARHSGNFAMRSVAATQLFGGINYQIEHHLFPSMCHMHYARVAPVVRATCAEFAIPYSAHDTLWSAYASYLRSLRHFGTDAVAAAAAGDGDADSAAAAAPVQAK